MDTEEKTYLFLAVVAEIPSGRVASYGQVAKLAGYPQNARLVGKIMGRASLYGDFPCHRVLRADGSLVDGWDAQRQLLQQEGIEVSDDNKVPMRKYQWVI